MRLIVSGTPSATPLAEPKLDVMSLRTMPLSVRTFGPFEPSPGNGPAVSSGISTHWSTVPLTWSPAGDEVVDVASSTSTCAAAVGVPLCDVHPTSAVAPTPASSVSARRRLISVRTSNSRPRS